MSALALLLVAALELGAAQAPASPPAATLPAGVEGKLREELPFVVAALSVPVDQPPALLPLLAAWLEQPESWPEGPVADLLRAGGRLRARAFADGLVVVAEGPAERQSEVVAAALALLSEQPPSAAGFEPARAEALTRRDAIAADDDVRARLSLWRAWYGEAAAQARTGPPERALLAASRADVLAVLDDVKRRSFGHRLFLEGAVEAEALPLVVGKLRPTWAPAGPPSLPRPSRADGAAALVLPAREDRAPGAAGVLVDDRPSPAAQTNAAAEPAALVIGHPLPPGPWSAVLGRAFERALERRLAPLGSARVQVEPGRHARLLVVTLRPTRGARGNDAGTASSVRAALELALLEAREQAAGDRLLSADLTAAEADLARAERRLGGWAERKARAHLTGPVLELPANKDALVGLLRISVLPEVLRAARRQEAAPPAADPSGASAKGPG